MLKYFADLHLNSFFHGNIKPDKIFQSNGVIQTDPGNTLFMNYKDEACLDDILDFTEQFVSSQMDSFTNWCYDIQMAMYEGSSQEERDNKIIDSKS